MIFCADVAFLTKIYFHLALRVASDGLVFDSIAATAKHYGISKGRVRYAMATGKKIVFDGERVVTFSGVVPYTAKV